MNTALLRFRLGGVPVSVQGSFLAIVALLGLTPGVTLARLVIWMVVVTGSVLVHEMGHATAARRLGASPTVELYGMGGVTRWQPTFEPSRGQLIGVSLAGPGAGFVVGTVVAALVAVLGSGHGDARFVVFVVLWVNLGWGLVNLVPVLPLDGGQVMAELLPGDRRTRRRRAAMVSIGFAVVGMVVLAALGIVFGAIVVAWTVMSNMAALRAERASDDRAEQASAAADVLARLGRGEPDARRAVLEMAAALEPANAGFRTAAIEVATVAGDGALATALLQAPGARLAPGVYALAFAAESNGAEGVEELIAITGREPTAEHARWLALALFRSGRLGALPSLLDHAAAPPEVLTATAEVVEQLGSPPTATALRMLAARAGSGGQPE